MVHGCGRWDQVDLTDFEVLETWFKTYGKLAVSRVRHLLIYVYSLPAEIKLDLTQFQAQIRFRKFVPSSLDEKKEMIKALALAFLSPDGQTKMTLQRFATLCKVLAAIDRKLRYCSKLADEPFHATIVEQAGSEIAEMLNDKK